MTEEKEIKLKGEEKRINTDEEFKDLQKLFSNNLNSRILSDEETALVTRYALEEQERDENADAGRNTIGEAASTARDSGLKDEKYFEKGFQKLFREGRDALEENNGLK